MEFTTGTLTRCSGNNHFELPVTIAGETRVLKLTLDDMQSDFEDREDAKAAIIARLRSARKEANANNFAQTRTAVENRTFRV